MSYTSKIYICIFVMYETYGSGSLSTISLFSALVKNESNIIYEEGGVRGAVCKSMCAERNQAPKLKKYEREGVAPFLQNTMQERFKCMNARGYYVVLIHGITQHVVALSFASVILHRHLCSVMMCFPQGDPRSDSIRIFHFLLDPTRTFIHVHSKSQLAKNALNLASTQSSSAGKGFSANPSKSLIHLRNRSAPRAGVGAIVP